MAGTWLSNNRAGGVSGGFTSISPTNGNLSVPLSVTGFHYNSGPSSRTGAFAGIVEPGDLVWAGTHNFDAFGLTIGDSYTFSSPTFGTFLGTVVSDTPSNLSGSGAGSRTLDLSGTFTPGTNSHYEGDTTTVTNTYLQIAYDRNVGGTVNAAWSLDTTQAEVPEPASIAIFALGAVGFATQRWRRK
ncbi:MAG: PEP-CTERM sorting domain-containing protein [Planctomycetota bacterium]